MLRQHAAPCTGDEVEWPQEVSFGRLTNATVPRKVDKELSWFMQALLLKELSDKGDAEALASAAVPINRFNRAVTTAGDTCFQSYLEWGLDCFQSTHSGQVRVPEDAESASQLSDVLLELSGCCDEKTAEKVFRLMHSRSQSVVEFNDALGTMMAISEEEQEESGGCGAEGLRRRLLALRYLQSCSTRSIDYTLGGSLTDLLDLGLDHEDPRCRVMAYDVVLENALITCVWPSLLCV